MASHKNQHFVPKVHLKPFNTDLDGRAVSIFNIKSRRLIHDAPIKHQCAKNYFYGKDGKLEKLLAEIEGHYANAVRAIQSRTINGENLIWLKFFMALQYARTEVAAQQIKEFFEKSSEITYRGNSIPESERPALDQQQIVLQSLGQIKAIRPYLEDLEFCVFENRTNTPYVTSDNPLINTNRYYCQKLGETSWGSMSAGALFILPLGPRLLACLFDPGVYAVRSGSGYAEVKKENDVIAFNEMQYLNAASNIYFSNPADGEQIAKQFEAVRTKRPTELVSLTEYLAIELPDGTERLVRAIPGMDEEGFDSKYVMYRVPRPIPPRWPSVLPFCIKPVAYSNGSLGGHVRHEKWMRGVKPP